MSTEMNVNAAELNAVDAELDTSGLDPLLRKIVENAIEEGRRQAAKQAAEVATERKSRVLGWKERQANRRAKEREVLVKGGVEIVETFVQEMAGPYLRLCSRDDVEKIKDLRITFVPGRCDQAGDTSVAIFDGNKRLSTIYKASLQQMKEKENRLLGRLQEKTGFTAGSPIEMMEEIARLQSILSTIQNGKEGRVAVCEAAQGVAMAYADNQDIDTSIEKLMEAFQK